MPTRLVIRVALAAAFAAGAVASALTYASIVRVDRVVDSFAARPDFRTALGGLRRSDSDLNPSDFRDQGIPVALLHLGHPAMAERVMLRAALAEPQNAIDWVALTRIRVARGRLVPALASWTHAHELDPHLPRRLPPPT